LEKTTTERERNAIRRSVFFFCIFFIER
jgi:hypothetical protein